MGGAGDPFFWAIRPSSPSEGVRCPIEAELLTSAYGVTNTSSMRWTIDHQSRDRLQDQIASCVRTGVASGELEVGEQLPPAAELGAALSVDRNTVLAAYRQLRDDGILEFRRGRAARVVSTGPSLSVVTEAAQKLIAMASDHGVAKNDLIQMIKELS